MGKRMERGTLSLSLFLSVSVCLSDGWTEDDNSHARARTHEEGTEKRASEPPMPAPGDVPEIEDAVRTPKGGLEKVRTRSRAPSIPKLDIGEVGGWVS